MDLTPKTLPARAGVAGARSLRAGLAAGVCLLSLTHACLQAQSRALHMSLGRNELAPLSFIMFCVGQPARCAPSDRAERVALDDVRRAQLEFVQRSVNLEIVPVRRPPNIVAPWREGASAGNCNDYAMTKRGRLLDLGWPSSALLLAVAAVPGGEGHLVLVVVTDRGDYVLDSLRDNVTLWSDLDYHWIKRSTPFDPQLWRAVVPPKRRTPAVFAGPSGRDVELKHDTVAIRALGR